MAPFTIIAGILTYIWPFVHSKSGYIAVAVVYGYVFLFRYDTFFRADG